MLLYYDSKGVVRLASTTPVEAGGYHCVTVDGPVDNPIGKRILLNTDKSIRVAIICNWNDDCGISSYTRYLVDALAPKVNALKIFSEHSQAPPVDTPHSTTYCWNRGQSMASAMKQLIEWKPTVVLIQHEFGIFPKATYLLQMLQMLETAHLPYVVTVHSVYEHLDKTVCTAPMRNIIVHSTTGEACLRRLGYRGTIGVIPHGCVTYDNVKEHWNIFQTPHAIMQFGFGFNYKGVDIALEAVAKLKREGVDDVFYTYLCAENRHVKNINNAYYSTLTEKVATLGIEDNVAILRGYQSEETLINYLRTAKLAVFPYITDPKNVVYGASGAIRLAMANKIPVVASSSHMFDDVEGVLPRPRDAASLANEISHIFKDEAYKQSVVERAVRYVYQNTWDVTADRYLAFLGRSIDSDRSDAILIDRGSDDK